MLSNLTEFMWATGIENTFVAHVRPGMRILDEYQLTQHYEQWRADLDRAAETGVRAMRWGIPWHRVQPQPDRWDWRWTDEVLDYMVNVKGITPILDLMHYGTPLWLHNSFINSRYPFYVAEYARAVAARYKSLARYYTPLNEPMINVEWCGFKGEWPPYLMGDDGYVKVLLGVAKGMSLTVQALAAEQPDLITVQVEALGRYWPRDESVADYVHFYNTQRYLAFDLCTGRVNEEYSLYPFLVANGMSDHDFAWFQAQAVTFDIFGANFYPWSYGKAGVRRDGTLYPLSSRTNGAKLAEVVEAVYARYNMPILITETSAKGSIARRARWMDQTVAAVRALRQRGIPLIGYTWFPLISMVDWTYRKGRRPLEKYLLHLGLYDVEQDAEGVLRRQSTPLIERYRRHIHTPMPPIGSTAE